MSTLFTILSLISPLAVLFLGWRQRFTLLWFYAAVGLICDNLGVVLRSLEINHRVSGNAFVLAELLFISFYYRDKIFRDKKVFTWLTVVLVAGFVVHTFWSSIFVMNFLGAGILCVVYVAYGIVGYLKTLSSPTVTYLNNYPFFWINTAFFLYAASNCLLFLFVTYLRKEDFDLMMNIWGHFFTVVNILHYIFIGIGLSKMQKREA